MSYEFHVGQKVVCVDDSRWCRCYPKPRRGSVYTIREILTSSDETGFRFLEIKSTPTDPFLSPPGGEFYFQSRYFRPVRKRETSIEIFRQLLNPSGVKETA